MRRLRTERFGSVACCLQEVGYFGDWENYWKLELGLITFWGAWGGWRFVGDF